MAKKKLNFVDLFAGAGGLSNGLEQAGHRCLLGVDYDKYAMETFALNHKEAKVYHGDICKLNATLLKKLIGPRRINIVVGGPPCQGFSTVGPGNPKDERNKLFMQFVRIVKTLSPEFIIVENVTGLVAKKNEKILKSIFKHFEKLGYNLSVQVMASEQYGVPEKRRRTIIIGSRVNQSITYPRPTHDSPKAPALTVGDALKELSDKNGFIHNHDLEKTKIHNKLELDRLKRIPEGRGIRYEKDEKAFLTKRLSLGVDWSKMRENRFRQMKYQRLDRSKPSPTIMTHRHSYYHPIEHRFLTQREAAALQSFPNDFIFSGPVSAQWRQIGNAVPPLLGKALGKAISKMYQQSVDNKSLKAHDDKIPINNRIDEIRSNAFLYSRPNEMT